MKELYQNEISCIQSEILEHNDNLIDLFFNFKNEDIEEVLIEIRAGRINPFSFWKTNDF